MIGLIWNGCKPKRLCNRGVIFLYRMSLCSMKTGLHSLPNDNFLDWSELKALADDKLNLAEN